MTPALRRLLGAARVRAAAALSAARARASATTDRKLLEMTPQARSSRDVPFGLKLSLLALLVCGALACVQLAKPAVHEWWLARGPVVPHDSFPADCTLCHVGDDWTTLRADFEFDHEAETGVPLVGAHARAECLRCHNDRGPAGAFAARGCVGCHEDIHRTQLGQACDRCHEQTSWRPKEEIAIHTRVGFPLEGSHLTAQCWQCHDGADQGVFTGAPRDCVGCHADQLAQAVQPDHLAQGWTTACERCHIPTSWGGDGFTHSTYPLIGTHRTIACEECHVGGVFAGTPDQCVDCHLDDYQGTTDPDHGQAGFDTDCAACHAPTSWGDGSFGHDDWPLTGSHLNASCTECHTGGVFAGLPGECVDCHLPEFNGADDPDHVAAGFPTDCAACHDTSRWQGGEFAHDSWRLSGAHTQADCAECHVGGVYAGLPGECVDCHLSDFEGTDDPDHVASGFPTACDDCHNTTTWDNANFTHDLWRLTGAHVATDCILCHTGGVFAGTPDECVDCHLADFQGADDPDHVAGGFPTACDQCHTTLLWERANFSHDGWPLSGAHATAACDTCHVGGVYAGTPQACIACHQSDLRGATDPDHVAAGFPNTCQDCHGTTTWQGASFRHSGWPLTGAHTLALCNDCHGGGTYAGLPDQCVDCHLAEYQGTNDPDHGAAGFPTSCDTCHSTTMWDGATFDHDFPINNGPHSNLDCTDCHLQPRAFAVFSCTHCHEHNQGDMAKDHSEVRGYVWASASCYQCHPDGND